MQIRNARSDGDQQEHLAANSALSSPVTICECLSLAQSNEEVVSQKRLRHRNETCSGAYYLVSDGSSFVPDLDSELPSTIS